MLIKLHIHITEDWIIKFRQYFYIWICGSVCTGYNFNQKALVEYKHLPRQQSMQYMTQIIKMSQDQVSRGLKPTTSHSRGPYSTRWAIREIPTSQASHSDFNTFWGSVTFSALHMKPFRGFLLVHINQQYWLIHCVINPITLASPTLGAKYHKTKVSRGLKP